MTQQLISGEFLQEMVENLILDTESPDDNSLIRCDDKLSMSSGGTSNKLQQH